MSTSRYGNRQDVIDRYDDGSDEERERVAFALYRRRGFAAYAWDHDTPQARGLRRDCRYLAEAAIEALRDGAS